MSIKFGEIDAAQILENEYRIGVLERLLEWLFAQNPSLRTPAEADMRRFRNETIAVLQKKYPNSGISYKEP